MHSGRSLPARTSGSSRTIVLAAMSVGRFNTRPNAPSGTKSQSSRTVLTKLGSWSCGIDTRRVGRKGSAMVSLSPAQLLHGPVDVFGHQRIAAGRLAVIHQRVHG